MLGYPKLFTKEGKTCNVNFLTSGNEKKMNETAEKLDSVIKGRAEAAGFKFVNPTSAFEAHEVCASEEWLNGQSNPLEESYHPNVKGQEEFTTLVEAAIERRDEIAGDARSVARVRRSSPHASQRPRLAAAGVGSADPTARPPQIAPSRRWQ